MRTLAIVLALLLLSTLSPGQVRPGPVGTLVVCSSLDPDGIVVADAYMSAWSIPSRNRLQIAWPLKKMGWMGTTPKAAEFVTLRQTIENYIETNRLEIDRVVFIGQMPYAYYGKFKQRRSGQAFLWSGSEDIVLNTAYEIGWGLAGRIERGQGRQYFQIYGYTRDQMLQMVARARQSDASHPSGTIYLQNTGSQVQNLRWYNTLMVVPEVRALGVNCTRESTGGWYANFSPKAQDVLGVLTGYGLHDTPLKPLMDNGAAGLLPGAIADHLTSGAGRLDIWYPNEYWHMNVLEWVKWGIAGTYGCVEEPFATQERFPHAKMYEMYANGASIGDTYWQSVRDLTMACFVADPLCAPFATRPTIACDLIPNSTVYGSQAVNVTAATTRAAGIAGVRAWLDDEPLGEWRAPGWRAGDKVVVTINGQTVSYTIPAETATRTQVADGVTAAVNNARLPVRALSGIEAYLRDSFLGKIVYPGHVRLACNADATTYPYSASGTGNVQVSTVGSSTYGHNTRPATGKWTLYGKGVLGDRIELHCWLDGKYVVVSATAATTSSYDIWRRLATAINAAPSLQGPEGFSATAVSGYLCYYLTLTGRDAKTHDRKILLVPRPANPEASTISVSPSGLADIILSGIAIAGDEATVTISIGSTKIPITVRSTGDRVTLGKAIFSAIRANTRLQQSDGVEAVLFRTNSTSAIVTLVPRSIAKVSLFTGPMWSTTFKRVPGSLSTLRVTGGTAAGAQWSAWALAGTNIAGTSVRLRMTDQAYSGSVSTMSSIGAPIDVAVTPQTNETMSALVNRAVIAAKANPLLVGSGVTFAGQALSTGRTVTIFAPKKLWRARLEATGPTGVGWKLLKGTADPDGFVPCEVVTGQSNVYVGKAVQLETASPDGMIGLGRIWINPGLQSFSTSFSIDSTKLIPGRHVLRLGTQDTSPEETWGMTTIPFEVKE